MSDCQVSHGFVIVPMDVLGADITDALHQLDAETSVLEDGAIAGQRISRTAATHSRKASRSGIVGMVIDLCTGGNRGAIAEKSDGNCERDAHTPVSPLPALHRTDSAELHSCKSTELTESYRTANNSTGLSTDDSSTDDGGSGDVPDAWANNTSSAATSNASANTGTSSAVDVSVVKGGLAEWVRRQLTYEALDRNLAQLMRERFSTSAAMDSIDGIPPAPPLSGTWWSRRRLPPTPALSANGCPLCQCDFACAEELALHDETATHNSKLREMHAADDWTPAFSAYWQSRSYKFVCIICYDPKGDNDRANCSALCGCGVCKGCAKELFTHKIMEGVVRINCPGCNAAAEEWNVWAAVEDEAIKARYTSLKTDLEKNPHVKTCPRCHAVNRLPGKRADAQSGDGYSNGDADVPAQEAILVPSPQKRRAQSLVPPQENGAPHVEAGPRARSTSLFSLSRLKSEKGPDCRVLCHACDFEFCFTCQAPVHEGVSCRQYQKGEKAFHQWRRGHAQKCPSCKVVIERTTGCAHMICSVCKTDFCYDCGCRMMHLKFFGGHHDALSVFGCKRLLFPNMPAARMMTRGALLTLGSPVAVAGAAVAAGVAVAASPFVGAAFIAKKISRR